MFPPVFGGRLRDGMQQFFVFLPLETWQVPGEKKKKNWSKSLLSIKPWVCANPYRLNPTTSGFALHLLRYLHLELSTYILALINAIKTLVFFLVTTFSKISTSNLKSKFFI